MSIVRKTMKFDIKAPLTCKWSVLEYVLRRVQDELFRIKNRVIQLYYQHDVDCRLHHQVHGSYLDDKEKYGVPFATHVYRVLTPEFPFSATSNITSTIQKATKLWNASRSDVMKGNMSIPSFKRANNPIEINGASIRNFHRVSQTSVEVDIALVSKAGVEKLRGDKRLSSESSESIATSYRILIHGGEKAAKKIMDRIVSGEYRHGGSMIIYNERKRKWMLSITYQFESETKAVNSNRILGVDLGMANVAYMAVSDSRHWRKCIEGGQIEKFRWTIEARKRKLLRQTLVCGNARVGYGRKKRMRPLDTLGHKIANFRNTINHSYARYIVKLAQDLGCGVIQIEDLTGISQGDKFLGRWTYFDLQTKIENKAKERGIDVRKIKPNWTSKRCSECGHIAHENRDIEKDRSKFNCVRCGYTTNADFNAARNISIPNIEDFIRSTCKALGLPYDNDNAKATAENVSAPAGTKVS